VLLIKRLQTGHDCFSYQSTAQNSLPALLQLEDFHIWKQLMEHLSCHYPTAYDTANMEKDALTDTGLSVQYENH
jgi:hypothetical protein